MLTNKEHVLYSVSHLTNANEAIQVAGQANIKVQCNINNVTALSVVYQCVCAGVDCYVRVFCALYSE